MCSGYRCGVLLLALGWAGVSCIGVSAQVRTPAVANAGPEKDLRTAMSSLAARAGLVFVGTVQHIERGEGVVEISLRVEQAIQGDPGSVYVLREWAGRWPLGTERYRIGQRALFFLTMPGPSGLSSPVDGADGVIPVLGSPAEGALLDVRRLNTRLLRQVGEKLPEQTTIPLADMTGVVINGSVGGSRPKNSPDAQPMPILRRGEGGARLVEVPGGAR